MINIHWVDGISSKIKNGMKRTGSHFDHQYLDYRLSKIQRSAESDSNRTPWVINSNFDAGEMLSFIHF